MGFLVSIKFMIGNDDTLLHHIFRPLLPTQEMASGPATWVQVDEYMRPVLKRWLAAVTDAPGTAISATIQPMAPLAT